MGPRMWWSWTALPGTFGAEAARGRLRTHAARDRRRLAKSAASEAGETGCWAPPWPEAAPRRSTPRPPAGHTCSDSSSLSWSSPHLTLYVPRLRARSRSPAGCGGGRRRRHALSAATCRRAALRHNQSAYRAGMSSHIDPGPTSATPSGDRGYRVAPMTREQVFSLIRAHLADELGLDPDSIQETTRFREDLSADSLDLYTLVQELEDSYGVKISDEQAGRILQRLARRWTSCSPPRQHRSTAASQGTDLSEHGAGLGEKGQRAADRPPGRPRCDLAPARRSAAGRADQARPHPLVMDREAARRSPSPRGPRRVGQGRLDQLVRQLIDQLVQDRTVACRRTI